MTYGRCSICDYAPGEGSFYSNRAPSANKLRYYPEKNEFICYDCIEIISDTLSAYDTPAEEEDEWEP